MAQITGSLSTYQSIGNREDLADIIYDISPTDTPFQTMAGRDTAEAVYTEWQTDTLAAVTTANAQIEGFEAVRATSAPTTRVGNYCQIMTKNATVTRTEDRIRKAGRSKEMAFQKAKRAKELKRDLEAVLLSHQGQTAGDDSTARTMRALGSWLTTNTSRGVSGANATAATAEPTNGTPRAFTDALLKPVLRSLFQNGGNATTIMVGPFNKQAASAFTGRTQARSNIDIETIGTAASLYASDFGDLKIVPNRFQYDRDAWVIDPDLVAVSWLRPWKSNELAVVGDSWTEQIVGEMTLKVKNEQGLGVVADLTIA